MYTIQYAKTPVRTAPNAIDLIVKFVEFDEEMPFTASPDDSMDYGRELYQRALNGEFGIIQQKQGD